MSTVEEMDIQVEAEFVEEVRDILDSLDVLVGNLRSRAVKEADGLAQIRRDMLNVEMRGSTLEQPMLVIVARRLCEYVSDLKGLDDAKLNDIQAFIDQIRSILDGKVEISNIAKVVRTLPARRVAEFDPKSVVVTNVEVLLVIPDKSTQRIVERELAACGYRSSCTPSPFKAIELAVRTQPEMIIISAVLDELSGIDLANAFASMPTTRETKVAVLTSYEWGHASLESLPVRVPIIRKGPQFGDDLAEALARLRIT